MIQSCRGLHVILLLSIQLSLASRVDEDEDQLEPAQPTCCCKKGTCKPGSENQQEQGNEQGKAVPMHLTDRGGEDICCKVRPGGCDNKMLRYVSHNYGYTIEELNAGKSTGGTCKSWQEINSDRRKRRHGRSRETTVARPQPGDEAKAAAEYYVEKIESGHNLHSWLNFNNAADDAVKKIFYLAAGLPAEGVVAHAASTGRTFLVGDLHGSLVSAVGVLLSIADRFPELPKANQSKLLICDDSVHYVFLGDYVDRGDNNMEVALLMLSYKTLCPRGVTMLSGNHEDIQVFRSYGFTDEIYERIEGKKWEQVEHAFRLAFDSLPFFATVEGAALAMHGGISESIEQKCSDAADDYFDKCISEADRESITWSDPDARLKEYGESPRGAGQRFGVTAANRFLLNTGYDMIFRGHEFKIEGWDKLHNKLQHAPVYTVFSSLKYGGANNKAAFAEIVADPSADGSFNVAPNVELHTITLEQGWALATKVFPPESSLMQSLSKAVHRPSTPKETGPEALKSAEAVEALCADPAAAGDNDAVLEQEWDDILVAEALPPGVTGAASDLHTAAMERIEEQGEALVKGLTRGQLCKAWAHDQAALQMFQKQNPDDVEGLQDLRHSVIQRMFVLYNAMQSSS